jgi:GTP-binding protein HflX
MKLHSDLQQAGTEPLDAILFGIVPHGEQRPAPEALRELALLADTGNFNVVGFVLQHRRSADPSSYFGAGKVQELAEIAHRARVTVLICNDSLSPTQGKHLEKSLRLPILDRSELILHIFDTHARTPQAKLQVELARLNYQLPRLKRMWTHLERQRGGIGMRAGAGEKQIDVDRSALRGRIAHLTRRLAEVGERKTREIRARTEQFSIAIVGYTNAGKSTIMNRLTGAGVLAEDRLFSTLDTRTRPWRLQGGRTVLVSDTVGFIQNLPHQLVASFHATLEEALNADLLFLAVDASSPDSLRELEVVDAVLEQLNSASIPRLVLLNKIDLLEDHSQLAPLLLREPKAIPMSARTGAGVDQLELRLQEHLATHENKVTILLPHSAGRLLSEIRSCTTVLSEFYTEEGSLIECVATPLILGRLLAKGASVSPGWHERHKRETE